MKTRQFSGGILLIAALCGCGSATGTAAGAANDTQTDLQLTDDTADVTVDVAADVAPDVAPDSAESDIPDGGPAVDCAKLVTDWSAFVASHGTCTGDADCVVVGGAGTCEAGGAIGQASGDAIAKAAKAAADVYLTAFYGPECKAYRDAHATWDAAPAQNLRCEAGVCKADWASCLVPPDVQSDAPDTSSDTSVSHIWTLFTVSQGGFCAPNSDCFSSWQVATDGSVATKKGGVVGSAMLSTGDFATLNAAIDTMAFLDKMKSGFTCSIPPTDISFSFSYALSGVKYDQDVTGCELSGGQDGALVQGIVALLQKY